MMKRCCFFFVAAFAVLAHADTIKLKNGVSIFADQVTTKGDVVEYIVGATKYYVLKSDVASIETTGTFGVTVGAGNTANLPGPTLGKPGAPAPNGKTTGPASLPGSRSARQLARELRPPEPPVTNESALLKRILNLGRVDERALYAIEGEGNPRITAAAYALAARHEFQGDNVEAARAYARRALDFMPDNVALLCWYSVILIQGGQTSEAISRSERAVELAGKSPAPLRILGFAYYQSNRVSDAVRVWKRALAVAPDDLLEYYIAKAERESAVEDSFAEQESSHFTLRYQGRQPGFGLRTELLRTLERQHQELSRDLGFAPQSSVTIILYTDKEFFDVTGAPSWAGGLNDGKVRIPVKDVSAMTPELERVTKHELTHSFIHATTHGRCPRWLEEGIAQMMEPRSSSMYGNELAEMFREGHEAPLRYLEGSFARLSPEQATVAYAESLAAVEYLRSSYGMNGLQRILEALADGDEGEDAVRSVTTRTYAQLEREIGDYLAKTYGQ